MASISVCLTGDPSSILGCGGFSLFRWQGSLGGVIWQSIKVVKQLMRPSTKEQIMKLLDINTMIQDYMASSQRKPKPVCHTMHSRPNANSIKDTPVTKISPQQHNKSSEVRSKSVRSITKKAVCEDSNTGNKSQVLNKTYSAKLSKQACMDRAPQRQRQARSHAKPPTKVFVSELNNFDEASNICHTIPYQNMHSTNQTRPDSQERKFFQPTHQTLKAGNTGKQKQRVRQSGSRLAVGRKKMGCLLRGRYQIERLIGTGLSGEVYKARDVLCDRSVAVKIIDPNNTEHNFIKELSHPNLICYYNSFLENNKRYIVLEFLPRTLNEVTRKRRLTSQQVKHVFKSIASGLMYLHSLSYAHRDIKLDNIVVSEDLQTVKFIDFGLCIDTSESSLSKMGQFCGTTSYMAPEVIAGECRQPKKADIWSLGVVLYSLSVGRAPFTGRQESEIFKKIKDRKLLFPTQMQQSLKDLLAGMLNKDPIQRLTILQVINHSWLYS